MSSELPSDLQKLIDIMNKRFTSGNSVQVERAHITRDEWISMVMLIMTLPLPEPPEVE